jgi:hypothetical protein
MKAWITKYALTEGIIQTDNAEITSISNNMIRYRRSSEHFEACVQKPDWHDSLNDAITQAEKMRKKKIASLHKQIERLENLKFI